MASIRGGAVGCARARRGRGVVPKLWPRVRRCWAASWEKQRAAEGTAGVRGGQSACKKRGQNCVGRRQVCRWRGPAAAANRCLPYLRYMRPLFPTLATANCLPSRPAEPPSGVISHLSSSWLPFFARRAARVSSCDARSVTGNSGFVCALAATQSFVFASPTPAGPRPVLARLASCPALGACCIGALSGAAGTRNGRSLGASGW